MKMTLILCHEMKQEIDLFLPRHIREWKNDRRNIHVWHCRRRICRSDGDPIWF